MVSLPRLFSCVVLYFLNFIVFFIVLTVGKEKTLLLLLFHRSKACTYTVFSEQCGAATCSGILSCCCRLGPIPRCVIGPQNCVASICGSTTCTAARPHCCLRGIVPYCSSSRRTCVYRCGNKVCTLSKPNCCQDGPLFTCRAAGDCETGYNLFLLNTCGSIKCPHVTPHCCGRDGPAPYCAVSSGACQADVAPCGSSVCFNSSSNSHCCTSGPNSFCTSQNDCESRQCGTRFCEDSNPLCCRKSSAAVYTNDEDTCNAIRPCGNRLCPSFAPYCCMLSPSPICVSGPEICISEREATESFSATTETDATRPPSETYSMNTTAMFSETSCGNTKCHSSSSTPHCCKIGKLSFCISDPRDCPSDSSEIEPDSKTTKTNTTLSSSETDSMYTTVMVFETRCGNTTCLSSSSSPYCCRSGNYPFCTTQNDCESRECEVFFVKDQIIFAAEAQTPTAHIVLQVKIHVFVANVAAMVSVRSVFHTVVVLAN